MVWVKCTAVLESMNNAIAIKLNLRRSEYANSGLALSVRRPPQAPNPTAARIGPPQVQSTCE